MKGFGGPAIIIACCTLIAGAGMTNVPAFERQVAPFPVLDADGVAMLQPFLGGFDVPRPQLVDIDGDGDLDLFVQERSNAVMYFENVQGTFTWRTDRFLDVPVGEWYRFVDIDKDGRVDLLSESPTSFIRAWRNVGTREAAKFEIAEDSVRDNNSAPIAADRQNILNAVDIDCNGRLDIFLGRVAGTVDRYEAVAGSERNGIPRFALHTERFENIEVLGPIPGQPGPSRIEQTGTRHGANTLAFGDIDGDGDVDLFWGDYFEQGLLLFENRAQGCGAPSMREMPRRFPDSTSVLTSGYNAATTGDVDGNGHLDVVLGVIGGSYAPRTTAVDNLYLISQKSKGQFEVATRRLIRTIDVGNESIPVLADVDGDGDLDLLIGNKIAPAEDGTGTVTWFENTGTAKAPAYRDRGFLPLRGEYHYAPAVADLDGDGLPDLVMGTWRDRVQWWRNTGSRTAPAWTLSDSTLVVLTRGSNTAPALADLDGDGDLDMIVGEASGQLNLYRNVGTKSAPKFELVSDTFQEIDVGRRSTPALADMDGDGKPDLLLGSEDGGVQLWRNTSAGGTVSFVLETGFKVETDPYSAPAVGDVDGDGRVEMVMGGQSGGVLWFVGKGKGR
ncbi:MAG: VCBS repeat-containing protein [Gemmatimonadaceae bacterium]